jgi:uncharacterized repeat protein (TIGR02543 family)
MYYVLYIMYYVLYIIYYILYISIVYYMAGKKRSGLASHRRAYDYYGIKQIKPVVPKTYTITYNINTDISGNPIIDTSSPYTTGSTVTILGNLGSLTKTGYTFSGWNTSEDGSGTSYSQGNTIIINANLILYAQWTPIVTITYTVTYNRNTDISGNPIIDTSSPYTAGSTVTILGNSVSLTKTGYTFSGWNTSQDGSGTSYSQGNTFIINSNITLYAKWTEIPVPSTPTSLSSVGGNQTAYILFTQIGNVTNYEYSTDNGQTFIPFNPPQIYSPVEINTLSSDGITRLTNGTMYNVKLKAVNYDVLSIESQSISVVPTITTLATNGRIIYLDANNSSSYPGNGNNWTNLDSNGNYSATLNGSPTFDITEPSNKYFQFNKGVATGQFAEINQATPINPILNQPFTIQMWVRINNVGSQGSIVSKVFGSPSYDGYALGYRTDNTLQLHENGSSRVNYFNSVSGVLSSGWALYTANIQFGNGGGRQNKIFVNGREVLNITSNETGIPSPTQNLTFPTGFYGEGECDIGQFFYYNTELTTTEIIQNYDATKNKYI